MSNICTTDIDIYDTKENIEKLHDAFKKATNMDDDIEYSWCYYSDRSVENLLKYIRYDGSEEINLHVHITFMHAEKNKLTITTDSEYSPQFKAIRLFIESITKTAKILFTGYEPMALGYVSNDPKVLKRHPDWVADLEDFDL